MIRPLRKRHQLMTFVLFPAALVVLILGASQQRNVPTQSPLPGPLQGDSGQGTLVWEQAVPTNPPLTARVYDQAAAARLELAFEQTPLIADGLVYWQADGEDGTRLLLGPLQSGPNSRFFLPEAGRQQAGRIVIHSLAHGEAVLAFALPQVKRASAAGAGGSP
ncbi:hypothetical protein [Acanthopleuribacter pedis]|uniref:Uncharacterized protein n=1 Tax=Acanthopleuribacter pedis TaxID=442870 RepID=A0A8J7Q6H6_9BACT|nr:hypothetical protein [Acanthopleuribacter pedis]MBO1317599.1 hypothetical protein [Acanthopleuribacter pedis]